ncbi:MAG: Gfo/Idh/MocA family oxidoreductase [Olegusella sp.]|nr:Gfo/Idh/MocA family oxidoreductase [Olegusella sp.]
MADMQKTNGAQVSGAQADPVRWGILGAGTIAHRFAASLAHEPGSRLVAISGRTPAHVRTFAEEFGVPASHAYLSHEDLLADPAVDAVYLSLPHNLHHEWAVRALRAGKAVLCEKPAAMTAEEAADIAAVARETGTLFMEAQKSRFVPLYAEVMDLIARGAVGEVMTVETSLCNEMSAAIRDPHSYMSDPACGGVLYDCGTYCASWLDALLPGDFTVRRCTARSIGEVNSFADAELVFAGGKTGWLQCAADERKPRQVTIIGTSGRLTLDELHRSQHAVLHEDGQMPLAIDTPYAVDDFYGEIAHFAELARTGAAESPVMPLAATVRVAQMLDAVRAAL